MGMVGMALEIERLVPKDAPSWVFVSCLYRAQAALEACEILWYKRRPKPATIAKNVVDQALRDFAEGRLERCAGAA